MYIDIKKTKISSALKPLYPVAIILPIVLAGLAWLLITADSLSQAWQIIMKFCFDDYWMVFMALFALLLMFVAVFWGILEWRKQNSRFDSPESIHGVEFTQEGLIVHTPQKKTLFPYSDSRVMLRGTFASHHWGTSLIKLKLKFGPKEGTLTEIDLVPSLDLLYKLADFKECDIRLSSFGGNDDTLAFEKEQIKNQRLYGIHRRHRVYFFPIFVPGLLLTLFSIFCLWLLGTHHFFTRLFTHLSDTYMLLIIGLGIVLVGIRFIISSSDSLHGGWELAQGGACILLIVVGASIVVDEFELILVLGFLLLGIYLLHSAVKEWCVTRKLKQLRGKKTN